MQIRIDDGETVEFCDFADFIRDNGYEADEADEIKAHLLAGETFSVGGGAAPLFHITAAKPALPWGSSPNGDMSALVGARDPQA